MHNLTDRILIGLGLLLRPINEPSFLCSLTVVIDVAVALSLRALRLDRASGR